MNSLTARTHFLLLPLLLTMGLVPTPAGAEGAPATARVRASKPLRPGILADYDAELRGPDGRVDSLGMAKRLHQLGVNTYFWLIWHRSTDWEDLQQFLPAAAKQHLRVWAYLVPPTESTPNTSAYAEPFRLDYQRWAEEIARLSLKNPNLVGWVIDDFDANSRLFTPEYVAQMQTRAHQVNPSLLFVPLMYFDEVTPAWVRSYHTVVDGVMVAYPQGPEQIESARAILNGKFGMPGLSFPGGTHSEPGDFAQISQTATVTDAGHASIHFRERDSYTGETTGYHFKQALVDDTVVWEQDAGGGSPTWQEVTIDVSPQVLGKKAVTIRFRLIDRRGVSNYPLVWQTTNLRLQGLKVRAGLNRPADWRAETRGAFQADFGHAARPSLPGVHVPYLVMTAAELSEFKMRHGDPATPPTCRRMAQNMHGRIPEGPVRWCGHLRPRQITDQPHFRPRRPALPHRAPLRPSVLH